MKLKLKHILSNGSLNLWMIAIIENDKMHVVDIEIFLILLVIIIT